MPQTSLSVAFPTEKEPYSPIKVRGELPKENFLNVESIPGLRELLRLQNRTFGDHTAPSYEIAFSEDHWSPLVPVLYLCVEDLQREFDYFAPVVRSVYFPLYNVHRMKEENREVYLNKFLPLLFEGEVSASSLQVIPAERNFSLRLYTNSMLTRSFVESLAFEIDVINARAHTLGIMAFDTYHDMRFRMLALKTKADTSDDKWENEVRYFLSLYGLFEKRRDGFLGPVRNWGKTTKEEINKSLDSIWLGDSESTVK